MYNVSFGQATGMAQTRTTGMPTMDVAHAKAAVLSIQVSINRPVAQGGVGAGLPLTGVFDLYTETALKSYLRSKGALDYIGAGMWKNLVAKGLLPEAGAKQWEAAIGFQKGWGGSGGTPAGMLTRASNVTLFKAASLAPTTKQLGPAPIPQPIPRTSLTPATGMVQSVPTPAPTTSVPPAGTLEQKTFTTYPAYAPGGAPAASMVETAPASDELVPSGLVPMVGTVMAPAEVRKGLPTWGWVLIGLGGAAAVGGLLWLVLRKRGGGSLSGFGMTKREASRWVREHDKRTWRIKEAGGTRYWNADAFCWTTAVVAATEYDLDDPLPKALPHPSRGGQTVRVDKPGPGSDPAWYAADDTEGPTASLEQARG